MRSSIKTLLASLGILGVTLGAYNFFQKDENVKPHNITQASFEKLPALHSIHSVHPVQGKIDVIYLPFEHVDALNPIATNDFRNTKSIEQICNSLYDNYGVRSLLIEGIDEKGVKPYRNKKRIHIDSDNITETGIEDCKALENLLNNRRWNLYNGESDELLKKSNPITKPLRTIHGQFSAFIDQKIQELNQAVESNDPNVEKMLKGMQEQFDEERGTLQRQSDIYLKPRIKQLYDLQITQRNNIIMKSAEQCKADGKLPLVVLYGSAHCDGLEKLFKERKIGHATLVPKGTKLEHFGEEYTPERMAKEMYTIPKATFTGK